MKSSKVWLALAGLIILLVCCVFTLCIAGSSVWFFANRSNVDDSQSSEPTAMSLLYRSPYDSTPKVTPESQTTVEIAPVAEAKQAATSTALPAPAIPVPPSITPTYTLPPTLTPTLPLPTSTWTDEPTWTSLPTWVDEPTQTREPTWTSAPTWTSVPVPTNTPRVIVQIPSGKWEYLTPDVMIKVEITSEDAQSGLITIVGTNYGNIQNPCRVFFGGITVYLENGEKKFKVIDNSGFVSGTFVNDDQIKISVIKDNLCNGATSGILTRTK